MRERTLRLGPELGRSGHHDNLPACRVFLHQPVRGYDVVQHKHPADGRAKPTVLLQGRGGEILCCARVGSQRQDLGIVSIGLRLSNPQVIADQPDHTDVGALM